MPVLLTSPPVISPAFQQRSLLALFPWQEMCVARRRASSPSFCCHGRKITEPPLLPWQLSLHLFFFPGPPVATVTIPFSLSLVTSSSLYPSSGHLLLLRNHLKFSSSQHGCHGNISPSPPSAPPTSLSNHFIVGYDTSISPQIGYDKRPQLNSSLSLGKGLQSKN